MAKRKSPLGFWLLAGWLVASLACNTLLPGHGIPSAPATLPVVESSPAAPSSPGASRAAPVPYGERAVTLDVSFRVLETLEGDEAWARLQQANQYNAPAPEGYTWILVHLEISNDSNREISGRAGNFLVTGNLGLAYFYTGEVPPAPRLPDTLAPGESADGWVPYLVRNRDGHLLIFYKSEDDPALTFLALSPGAAVALPDLSGIPPTDLGSRPEAPAPPGTTVTTKDWQFHIDEALHGDAAWQAVQQANAYNDPPADGREYLAVHMTVRALHADETYHALLASKITCLDGDTAYERARVVPPHPDITQSRLFPGATDDGWLVFDVAQGAACTLHYEALFDYQNIYTRYLALP
ncbi:MAG: hypothetical protein Fur0018_01330 [Anaerolineales bacterium]